jgi:transcriptional regulator with XRE-family HTH domain
LRRTAEEQNVSTFGKRVTELRKEKNLTQKALGEIVGVTKNTVSTWERDLRMPEFETLNALCSFFGVNTAYLLGEYVERKEDSGSPLDDETAALYVLDDLAEESEPYVKN